MKRTIGIILTVACLALAIFTGSHLYQSITAQHELRHQVADLSLADTAGPAPTSALHTADASLNAALQQVRHTAHTQELALTAELLGLLAGIVILFGQPRPRSI